MPHWSYLYEIIVLALFCLKQGMYEVFIGIVLLEATIMVNVLILFYLKLEVLNYNNTYYMYDADTLVMPCVHNICIAIVLFDATCRCYMCWCCNMLS